METSATRRRPRDSGPFPLGPRSAERPARGDPAAVLLGDLVTGGYRSPADVASGRFLRDFEKDRGKLSTIDPEELRPLRRGAGWVEFEAPFRPEGAKGDEGPATARVRLVKSEGSWKVEHVTWLPRKFHEER